MPISEKIDKDLLLAMKSQDKGEEVSLLRMLKSSIKNKEIEKREDLSDEETIELLSKEAKKRKESAEIYQKAGRQELADKELSEANMISKYLPEQMPDSELASIVMNVIKETEAKGMQDMGKIMPAVMAKVRGRASGSEVSKKVQEILNK